MTRTVGRSYITSIKKRAIKKEMSTSILCMHTVCIALRLVMYADPLTCNSTTTSFPDQLLSHQNPLQLQKIHRHQNDIEYFLILNMSMYYQILFLMYHTRP